MSPTDRRQAYEAIVSDDELAANYGRASAFMKTLYDKDFWLNPQVEQMRQVSSFVTKTLGDYRKMADRIEDSILPAEGSRLGDKGTFKSFPSFSTPHLIPHLVFPCFPLKCCGSVGRMQRFVYCGFTILQIFGGSLAWYRDHWSPMGRRSERKSRRSLHGTKRHRRSVSRWCQCGAYCRDGR